MSNNSAAVVVMGRVPKAGKVKTRLTSVWSQDEAALLYTAFLADVGRLVDRAAQRRPFRKYFCCVWENEDDKRIAKTLVPNDWTIFEQTTGGLGERIEHARQFTGCHYVVVLGSDSPAMPEERIIAAFNALASKDIVVGPVEDGGYDLIGFSGSKPAVLSDISWSTEHVLSQTREKANNAGYTIEELDMSFDIDFPEDLERVLQQFENISDICPNTTMVVQKLKAHKS